MTWSGFTLWKAKTGTFLGPILSFLFAPPMSNFRQIVPPGRIIMSFRRSFRLAGPCALCLFAAGCSSVHGLLFFDRDRPDPVAAVAPAIPVAPAPAEPVSAQPDEWCMHVAANDRAQAVADGFDAATRDRVTLQSYQQCAMLKGP
jgi:hypothetical protein